MLKVKIAIVLNSVGNFGGAQKRFINLYKYFYKLYPENFFFLVSYDLYDRALKVFNDFPTSNLFRIGAKTILDSTSLTVHPNLENRKSRKCFLRKLYKLQKNYRFQRRIYNEIRRISDINNIKIFIGVASGIIPLYFYLKRNKNIVIFSNMDSWFSDIVPKEELWYRKYSSYNYALENSDFIDFLNPYILNGVIERGIKINKEKVSIAPCSFTDYSNCKFGDKSVFQVAFSGRLEERKNPLLFLEAAEILSKTFPDVVFHIMGEGRLYNSVKQKVEAINSGNIIFHGFHTNPPDILSNTSVFVSIQSTNNYPSQSVLEAMGCGNAIVASDVGDTRMFVNEKNGILINLRKEELIKAIEQLYLNRHLCREKCEYSYQYVRENHTIERMANYYLNLFDKVMKLKNI